MLTFTSIGDFLLDKWIWSMTFDSYHLVVNLFLMAFLFRGMSHSVYTRSFLFSLVLQLFALGAFAFVVVGILHYGFGWEYVHPEVAELPTYNYVMRACFFLGIIYSIFQTLFIEGMHFYQPFVRRPYLIVIWMGNFVSAVISYCLILFISSMHL